MPRSTVLAQRRKQLFGPWRSDAKRTLEELAKKRMPSKSFKTFQKIFGKLRLTYRPSTIISEFKGKRATFRYKILGADAHSIAILVDEKLPFGLGRPKIRQINFEGDYYWISLGGMREFFKRINPESIVLKKNKKIPPLCDGKANAKDLSKSWVVALLMSTSNIREAVSMSRRDG